MGIRFILNMQYICNLMILLYLFPLLSACQTPEVEKEKPTHFTLKMGVSQKSHSSLPDYTPIYIQLRQGENIIKSYLGYRAWDFNKNGRFDLLEALDEQGKILIRAYDFDFDGNVDATNKGEGAKLKDSSFGWRTDDEGDSWANRDQEDTSLNVDRLVPKRLERETFLEK